MNNERQGIEPAAALARWLLDGPARIRSGVHFGAVAGCVDGDGSACYAYPEITGYFLQWLAWRVARGDDISLLSPLAVSAQRWLGRWCVGERPLSRVYLGLPEPDWRNDALFCFDLAMVLRGLAAARRARLLEADPALIAALAALALKLVEPDGGLAACVPVGSAIELPERWSTRRGGFLAKAAAGILDTSAELPGMPARLVAAAEVSFTSSVQALVAAPHVEVHPLLYGFEGVLTRPDDPRSLAVLPKLAAQFDALLEVAYALGGVPESLSAATTQNLARCDVLAQTLRVGALLARLRPDRPPVPAILARLRALLLSRIKANGALPFGTGAGHATDNVWATMFAEQALVLTASDSVMARLPNAGSLLV